jgi:hypothetical protein
MKMSIRKTVCAAALFLTAFSLCAYGEINNAENPDNVPALSVSQGSKPFREIKPVTAPPCGNL